MFAKILGQTLKRICPSLPPTVERRSTTLQRADKKTLANSDRTWRHGG
jgi:hypothetical protein